MGIISLKNGKTAVDCRSLLAVTIAQSEVTTHLHMHMRGGLGAISVTYGEGDRDLAKKDHERLMEAWERAQCRVVTSGPDPDDDEDLFG